jgi:hypothetical protein
LNLLIGALVTLGGEMQGIRQKNMYFFMGSMALPLAPECGVHGYE